MTFYVLIGISCAYGISLSFFGRNTYSNSLPVFKNSVIVLCFLTRIFFFFFFGSGFLSSSSLGRRSEATAVLSCIQLSWSPSSDLSCQLWDFGWVPEMATAGVQGEKLPNVMMWGWECRSPIEMYFETNSQKNKL